MSEETKTCDMCEKNFPATKEYFYKNGRGGLRNICKRCFLDSTKENAKKYQEIQKRKRAEKRKKREEERRLREQKEGRKCRKCGEKYPPTTEYFYASKSHKDGINTVCIFCLRKQDREIYARKVGGYKPLDTLNQIRDRKDDKAYQKLLNEPRSKGIGDKLDTLKFQIGKKYKIERRKNEKNEYEDYFIGVMVQDNNDHVTLRHKRGYCESFRKYDFLCGEYKIEEVRK